MSLQLPHNCRTGKISVHPSTWDQPGASTKEEWYIHYRFHDPNFRQQYPKGFLVPVRGMNHAKGLQERRQITRALIENEKKILLDGYNPIRKKTIPRNDIAISPLMPFSEALDRAYKLLPATPTKNEIRKALPHISKALKDVGYDFLPVQEIRQHHLEVMLIQVGENKKQAYKEQRANLIKLKRNASDRISNQRRPIPTEWGAAGFNHYRSYLLILFKQLKKVGATEVKPVDDIELKACGKSEREGLTPEQMDQVFDHLKPNYYTFWRFSRIFYRSGARVTELMGVMFEDVDLQARKVWVWIKKRKGGMVRKFKTITADVLALWQELMAEARAGQYLFSEDLRPGAARISSRQITIRWKWHVKEKLGITADFYELKHTNTTKVIDMALKKIDDATKVAAEINSHTSTDMSRKIYDLDAEERLHRELLKNSAQPR